MDNKIAMVTGVSRLKGIGRAICLELASAGYDIFFTYWTSYDKSMPWGIEADEPDTIRDELKKLGVRSEHVEFDLSVEGASDLLLEKVYTSLGYPKVLINNATYSTKTSIDTLTSEELDRHYQINVRATTLLSLKFIRDFKFEKGGRIINLNSGQALGPMPNEIAYAITKSAIVMLTETLASEIGKRGITINSVNPGPNDTGWMDEKLRSELLPRFPMNRIGQPMDIANLIGFLVSEKGEWITGQNINSEGGFIR